MKRFFALTFFALHFALHTSGQEDSSNMFITKGEWLVGGTMSFLASTGSSAFSLEPGAGYFIGEKFATGLALSYRSEESINIFSFLPFVRYYFSQKRLAPYAGFGVGVASESTVFFTPSIGIDYFISKNVAFETNLAYFQILQTNGSQSAVGLTAGLQFFLR